MAKTLGACSPSGFGLGNSLGTTFTMIPPQLFQIMSHCTEHYTEYYIAILHTLLHNNCTMTATVYCTDNHKVYTNQYIVQ